MCWLTGQLLANPVAGMLERIDKGASKKFSIEIKSIGNEDYFELDQKGNRVVVRANNYVSAASGVNWYLKYSTVRWGDTRPSYFADTLFSQNIDGLQTFNLK